MTTNKSLEDRIRAIEDQLEIYNLIASHPPSADTAGSDHIAASWAEDGVFDRGENLSSPRGRENIANQVLSADHQAAIARGLAHFTSLPHVAVDGDSAVVTSYLQILVPQTQGDPVDVPNHGSSKGFRVHRMTANRWELVRTAQGWRIKRRILRQLDGSEPARKILRQAIAG
jgi:SnoaL-like domain